MSSETSRLGQRGVSRCDKIERRKAGFVLYFRRFISLMFGTTRNAAALAQPAVLIIRSEKLAALSKKTIIRIAKKTI